MTRVKKRLTCLANLPGAHQRELARAVVVVCLARLALSLLPYRYLGPLLFARKPAMRSRRAMTESDVIARVAWAVTAAARVVPAGTCLVQAWATKILLERHEIPSTLRLGATRTPAGAFRAHAWIECDGRVVVGGKESPGIYRGLQATYSTKEVHGDEGLSQLSSFAEQRLCSHI
jgi:hypothetical protein